MPYNTDRPNPPLQVVGVEIHRQAAVAVYYTVTFVDAAGMKWEVQNANFMYDLQPVPVLR